SAGFVEHSDLTSNGNARFFGLFGRLTTNVNERGSFFTNQRVNIDSFPTRFVFRVHDGTNPPADGFAFVIQGNSPLALGAVGGALGYGPAQFQPARGIRNSVAVKFDFYSNLGEGDNSTGLFTDGRQPMVREFGLPPPI